MQHVYMGNALEAIHMGAFGDTFRLKEITIPSSVKEIQDHAFSCLYQDETVETYIITELSDEELCVGDRMKSVWLGRYIQITRGYFKLELDANGADISTNYDMRVMDNIEFTVPDCKYSKSGYEFVRWNTQRDGNGTDYEPGDVISLRADPESTVTLYALWDNEFYNIHFAAGVQEPMEGIAKKYKYTLPLIDYEKSGYQFIEWNTKEDGTGTAYRDGDTIQGIGNDGETIVLYAQWKLIPISITYILNGGENDSRNPGLITMEDGRVSVYNPTKTGKAFKGWTVTGSKSFGAYKDYYYIDARDGNDIVMEAVWVEVDEYLHKITWDGNGATSGNLEDDIYYYYVSVDWPETNAYSRVGYQFNGWNTKEDGSGETVTPWNLYLPKYGRDITFYAMWQEWPGQVTFVTNTSYSQISINPSMVDSKLPDPELEEGYRFCGWYTDRKGTTKLETYGDIYRELLSTCNSCMVYGMIENTCKSEDGFVMVSYDLQGEIVMRTYLEGANLPDAICFQVENGEKIQIDLPEGTKHIIDSQLWSAVDIPLNPTQLRDAVELIFVRDGVETKKYLGSFYACYNPDYRGDAVAGLITVMRDYGAYAQLYFGINTDLLATNNISETMARVDKVQAEDLAQYAAKVNGSESGIVYYGSSLMVENKICVRHYFTVDDKAKLKQIKITIDGKTVTPVEKDGMYYVETDGIPPAEMHHMHKLKIGGVEIEYCPYSYVYKVLANESYKDSKLVSLCKALYLYGTEAAKYFDVK